MEKSTLKLTRKIRLLVDLPTSDERKEAIGKLYQWQNRCFRAANMIVSHLYVQEMIKDFFYFSEGIKYKLADEKKDENGMLQRSRQNTTYRVVVDHFKGEIPTNILGNLNRILISTFLKNRKAYGSGERSLMNFRRDIPLPFDMDGVKGLCYNEEKKAFCFRLFSIPLKTYLRKETDKHRLMERVITGESKLCTSHIQLKDGKTYLLAVFDIEKDKHKHILNPAVMAEATMSLEHPIVVKIGRAKLNIGSREEFLFRRLAIQASRSRAKTAVSYSRSGKGYKSIGKV